MREASEALVEAALAKVALAAAEDKDVCEAKAQDTLATALEKVQQAIEAETKARDAVLSASPTLLAINAKKNNNTISEEELKKAEEIKRKIKTSYTYDVTCLENQVIEKFQEQLGYEIRIRDTFPKLEKAGQEALDSKSKYINGYQYFVSINGTTQLITEEKRIGLKLICATKEPCLKVEEKYTALVKVLAESQAKVIENALTEIKRELQLSGGSEQVSLKDQKKAAVALVKARYVYNKVQIKVKSGDKVMDAAKAIAEIALNQSTSEEEALEKVQQAINAEVEAREAAISISPKLQAINTELQIIQKECIRLTNENQRSEAEKYKKLIYEKKVEVKSLIIKKMSERTHDKSSIVREAVKKFLISQINTRAQNILGNTKQEEEQFYQRASELENELIKKLLITKIRQRNTESDLPELSKTLERLVREDKIRITNQSARVRSEEKDPFKEKVKELVELLKKSVNKTEEVTPSSSVAPRESKILGRETKEEEDINHS